MEHQKCTLKSFFGGQRIENQFSVFPREMGDLPINYRARESFTKLLVISEARWKIHGLVNSLDTHFSCELILHVSNDGKLWNLVKLITSKWSLLVGKRWKRETNKPQHKNKQERNFTKSTSTCRKKKRKTPVQNNLIHFGAVLMLLDCEVHFFCVKFEDS